MTQSMMTQAGVPAIARALEAVSRSLSGGRARSRNEIGPSRSAADLEVSR
jgi:hypothetical protein